MDYTVIIPTLDPNSKLVSLVQELGDYGFSRIVIVNDGTQKKASLDVLDEVKATGAIVVSHKTNRGKGAAIKTGIRTMLRLFPESPAFVTVDGDGQHAPYDVFRVCKALEVRNAANQDTPAIILGSRNFALSSVPARSRLGNAFSAAYFKLDTGRTCKDTQTGLRCIPTTLAPLALSTEGERYEYEMAFLTEAARSGISIEEVPIRTIYENNNADSHFNPLLDSVRIYKTLIKFAASSISCAALDLILFTVLVMTLNLSTAPLVAIATATARLTSGGVNFALNRQWSFGSDGPLKAQTLRYIALFIGIMLASTVGVTALAFLPLPLTAIKIGVDGALSIVSYFAQRNWVFKERLSEKTADAQFKPRKLLSIDE